MEVGRFGEGSAYAGRRLMFVDNGFVIDGVGVFPIRDVAVMSAAGGITWASEELRAWSCEIFAHATQEPSLVAVTPQLEVATVPGAPQSQAPSSPRPVDPRLRKYSIAYAVLVAVHVVIGIAAGPLVSGYMASVGGSAPLPSELVAGLSNMYLLAPMLVVLDVVVFVPLYLLARFYRFGFIIAALAINLAVTGALAYAVYLPRFEVITLVK